MIRQERHELGVIELVLDWRERRNAFSISAWRDLAQALRTLKDDAACRVLILSSGIEGMFSPGADIGEFPELMNSETRRGDLQEAMQDCCNTLENLPQTTIALIDGPCVGGGCSLALACDLRIATARSRFGVTPAKLGLVYGLADTRRLLRAVGDTHTRRLLFTGKLIGAAEALSMGLATEVCEEAQLRETGEALAKVIAGNSVHTIACAKGMLHQIEYGQTADDAHTQALFRDSFVTAEARAKITAFLDASRVRKRGDQREPKG